jgi:cytochrome c oxidase subunit 4
MADHAHGEHGTAEPPHSARTYIIVFVVLMVLAGATYALGEGKLGSWSLPFAMGVATIKALLVMTFFMHLNEHKGAVRVTMAVAFIFLGILIAITIGDVATRFPPSTPSKAPFGVEMPHHSAPHDPNGPGGH